MNRFPRSLIHGIAATVAMLAGAAQAAPLTPPGYTCATPRALATRACLDVLAGGGNAFDAAVAASAVLAVVAPDATGLGGGGFWLLHRASDDLDVLIDSREFAPGATTAMMFRNAGGKAAAERARYGSRAAAIPGEPAALEHIARRYGSKPLAALLAPAIAHARDGYAIDPAFAQAIASASPHLSWAAKKLLMLNGHPLAAGALLQQPDLAETLAQLAAQGRDGFYEGAVADKLLKAIQATDGVWAADDLRRYQIIEREPLRFDFRGYRVITAPPPSAGGVALAQLFGQLEALAWRDDGAAPNQHLWNESLRRMDRDRTSLGDPDFTRVPTADLVARVHIRDLADGADTRHAAPGVSAASKREEQIGAQLSVLDAKGNRVAATLSIGAPFGSGFVAPGTGVFLNDAMGDFGTGGAQANAIAPYKRPLSSMAPAFVEGPRGLLLIGAPDGDRASATAALGIAAWLRGAPGSNSDLQGVSWDVGAGQLSPTAKR